MVKNLENTHTHNIDVVVVASSVVFDPLGPHGLQPIRLLYPRDFPGKNTGVGCHFLLPQIVLKLQQKIFLMEITEMGNMRNSTGQTNQFL